jgi:hypothetical protein
VDDSLTRVTGSSRKRCFASTTANQKRDIRNLDSE